MTAEAGQDAGAAAVEATLSLAEEHYLRLAFERDHWAGEWNSLPTAIDRLLASRAATLGTTTADAVRAALTELVDLKDGPKDADYERRKPLAWAAARAAVREVRAAQESRHG